MIRTSNALNRGLFVSGAFALMLAMGCEGGESNVKVEETPVDPQAPAAQVDLPDPPPASGFKVPERNNDNTLRVEGVIHYQDKYLDQKVEVSGVIISISEKCDPKKAKKAGEKCPEPNLFIKDDEDGQKMMRVVGYDEDFMKKAKLKVGDRHVFKGTYQKVAQGFVATEDGLILVDYVDDKAVLEEK